MALDHDSPDTSRKTIAGASALELAQERQRRLHGIIGALNRGEGLNEILRRVRDAVVDAGGFERCGVFVVEGEGENLQLRGSWGTDPEGGVRDERDLAYS